MTEEHVLEEIRPKLFRKPVDAIAFAAYITVNALVFLLYVVPGLNSPEPSFAGLSTAFAYALAVWIVLMLLLIVVAVYVWRG